MGGRAKEPIPPAPHFPQDTATLASSDPHSGEEVCRKGPRRLDPTWGLSIMPLEASVPGTLMAAGSAEGTALDLDRCPVPTGLLPLERPKHTEPTGPLVCHVIDGWTATYDHSEACCPLAVTLKTWRALPSSQLAGQAIKGARSSGWWQTDQVLTQRRHRPQNPEQLWP